MQIYCRRVVCILFLFCCPWGCAVWKGLLGYCWQVVQPSCLGFLILSRGSRLPGCRDSGAICCITASTCCRPPSNRRSDVRSECSLWHPTALSSGVPPGYPAGHIRWVWWGSSHLTPRAAQDQVISTHGRFSFKRGHFQLQEYLDSLKANYQAECSFGISGKEDILSVWEIVMTYEYRTVQKAWAVQVSLKNKTKLKNNRPEDIADHSDTLS